MPVEGSRLEELVALVGPLDEEGISNLLDKLGEDREFTLEEVTPLVKEVTPAKEKALNRGQRRQHLVDTLAQHHLTLKDDPRDELIATIALRSEGYVGSDIESLCREAGIFAMREGAENVTLRHFELSLDKVHPTMNERLRESYNRIRQHFKGGLPKEVQPPEYQ